MRSIWNVIFIILVLTASINISLLAFAQDSPNDQIQTIPAELSVLKEGDYGPYKDLVLRPNPTKLRLVYTPALATLLERAKKLKKSDLSDDEIQSIKNRAPVTAMSERVADRTIKIRNGLE